MKEFWSEFWDTIARQQRNATIAIGIIGAIGAVWSIAKWKTPAIGWVLAVVFAAAFFVAALAGQALGERRDGRAIDARIAGLEAEERQLRDEESAFMAAPSIMIPDPGGAPRYEFPFEKELRFHDKFGERRAKIDRELAECRAMRP